MSNTLQTKRAELGQVLTAGGLKVHLKFEPRMTPPAAVIAPGSPYLEPADRFGHFILRWYVGLVSAPASYQIGSEELDAMISRVAVALFESDFILERVEQPETMTMGTAEYQSARLEIRTQSVLEYGEG